MEQELKIGFLFFLFCLIWSQLNFASEPAHDFTYTGQQIDTVLLSNVLQETRYRTETYETTCHRQVPYQDTECGNETRYRQECTTIPGHEDCHNVTDRECNNVTRYRNECHREPGREVCHHEPGREVCTNRPDREECSIVNGRRICRRVPGGRECHTVGGGRQCHTEPGREVCRSVPYTDQECRNITRRECNWVPARQDCRQIAYQEYVCHTVTRYRTESYACTQTREIPYTVTLKTYQAEVDFNFVPVDQNLQTQFKISLDTAGKLNLLAQDASTPSVFVQIIKHISQTEVNNLVTIKALYDVRFINTNEYTGIFEGNFELHSFDQDEMTFRIGEMNHPDKTIITLTFKQDEHTWIDRILEEEDFQATPSENSTLLKIDLANLNIPKFWGTFTFNLKVQVELPEGIEATDDQVLTKEQAFTKVIAPPYEILHRTVHIANLKKLAKKSWLSDNTAYKKKIRKKTIELFKTAGIEVEVNLDSITLPKDDQPASLLLIFKTEFSNEQIIEIFTRQEIDASI